MITCLCEISSSNPTQGNQSKGYLYFERGELYQAYYERLKGNKAALKIFRMNDVTAKFKKPSGKGHIARTITQNTESLMLEAMRQKDEIKTPEVKRAIEKMQAKKKENEKSVSYFVPIT
ncbi:DUF4388 domain-containing protein [Desulfococcaceae bacterium HSG9]|nr:DUF4388 domain-containing protein [Desulfococcaceae bacterium HSG9]